MPIHTEGGLLIVEQAAFGVFVSGGAASVRLRLTA